MKDLKNKARNLKNKVTNFINKMVLKVTDVTTIVKYKVFGVFAQNTGEGFVDTALKILISVVVGALLLAGLYLLFEDTILPELSKRIEEMFNYKG